jgi:transcriptional antiterminator RfaH
LITSVENQMIVWTVLKLLGAKNKKRLIKKILDECVLREYRGGCGNYSSGSLLRELERSVKKKVIMPVEWYALRSKPNKEELLLDQLLIRKLEAFFPRIRVKPVNHRSRHVRAYFPGYLFVKVQLEQVRFSDLAWIPGASRLVCFDGEPASISESMIFGIKNKVDSINAAGGERLASFKPGDRVSISAGPFAGYEGVFDDCLDGKERVRVLLNMLQNRHMRLEIPLGQVQLQK